MKRLVLLSAAALSVAILAIPEAVAQRRGGAGVPAGGVAFGGASIRVQSVRAAAAQPTFQGARSTITRRPAVAPPRGTHSHGARANAAHPHGAHRGTEFDRHATKAPRHRIRLPGIGQAPIANMARLSRWRWHGHRRGWGLPVETVGLWPAYYDASYPTYADCLAWDGYAWVNVCNGYPGSDEP
jgi:hypothetical protein